MCQAPRACIRIKEKGRLAQCDDTPCCCRSLLQLSLVSNRSSLVRTKCFFFVFCLIRYHIQSNILGANIVLDVDSFVTSLCIRYCSMCQLSRACIRKEGGGRRASCDIHSPAAPRCCCCQQELSSVVCCCLLLLLLQQEEVAANNKKNVLGGLLDRGITSIVFYFILFRRVNTVGHGVCSFGIVRSFFHKKQRF